MFELTQEQKQGMIDESILRLKQVGAKVSTMNNCIHLMFTVGVQKGDLYPTTGTWLFNGLKGKGLDQLLKHVNNYKLKLNSH